MPQNIVEIIIKAIDNTKSGLTSPINNLQDLEKNLGKLKLFTLGTAAAVATGIAIMVDKAIESAAAFQEMSERTGITTERLSTLAYAGSLVNVSTEQMETGIKKLSVAMLDAHKGTGATAQVFERLGIAVNDAQGRMKSNQQVLLEVADRFSKMKDGAEKAADAVKLFGRSGTDMIPLLDKGAAGIKNMQDEARQFGLEISGATAKNAKEFEQNITRIKEAFEGAVMVATSEVLPYLKELSDEFLDSAKNGGILKDVLIGFSETIVGAVKFVVFAFDEAKAQVREVANVINAVVLFIVDLIKSIAVQAQMIWDVFHGNFKKAKSDAIELWNEIKNDAKTAYSNMTEDANQFSKEMQKLLYGNAKVSKEVNDEGVQDVRTTEEEKLAALKKIYEERVKLAKVKMKEMQNEDKKFFEAFVKSTEEAKVTAADFALKIAESFKNGLQKSISDTLLQVKSLNQAIKELGDAMIKAVVDYIAQKVAAFAEEKVLGAAAQAIFGAQAASSILEAGALAGAWSPAAAMVSLASFGTNALPAQTALASTTAMAETLAKAGGLEEGTDRVPRTGVAILHEEERVVPRDDNKRLREFLKTQKDGAGTARQINIQISGKTLASIIIDLARKGDLPIQVNA